MWSIVQGDAREVLSTYDSESIDAVVTSPSYKEEDGYDEEMLRDVFVHLYAVLQPGGLFFLNFGHLAHDKFRPFRTCRMAMDHGFLLNDTITWCKTQFSPIHGSRRLNNLTEFIFLLYKEWMPDLDRLAIGVPYDDKSNVGRYSDHDLRCQGNFWRFGYETIQHRDEKLHPDRFPLELPLRCLRLAGLARYGPPAATVLDPFVGSGTTCVAAQMLGLNSLGIDLDSACVEVARRRVQLMASSVGTKDVGAI
jgi:site-specific DNA-methyltransferase (adenine-specific)